MQAQFLQIIQEHQRIIHKICLLYRNSKEDQEDLFQEIVFQLWKSFGKFRGDSKVSSWMYRIALNTALATFRKKKASLEFRASLPDQHQPTKEMSEHEQLLFLAIKQLSDSDKALVSLYLEDFSYREIAEISGLTESNVGVKLNRIKKKLKHILNSN